MKASLGFLLLMTGGTAIDSNNSYSIENMEGHGAEDRTVTHILTIDEGEHLRELYEDSKGAYWYRTMIRLEGGEIVSMFGKKSQSKKRRQYYSHRYQQI